MRIQCQGSWDYTHNVSAAMTLYLEIYTLERWNYKNVWEYIRNIKKRNMQGNMWRKPRLQASKHTKQYCLLWKLVFEVKF